MNPQESMIRFKALSYHLYICSLEIVKAKIDVNNGLVRYQRLRPFVCTEGKSFKVSQCVEWIHLQSVFIVIRSGAAVVTDHLWVLHVNLIHGLVPYRARSEGIKRGVEYLQTDIVFDCLGEHSGTTSENFIPMDKQSFKMDVLSS